MRKLNIAIIATCFGLSACETALPTAYQAFDARNGGGVSVSKLGENSVSIAANGNSLITLEAMVDYTMLKAAEITKERGKNCFNILKMVADTSETFNQAGQYAYILERPHAILNIEITDEEDRCKGENADSLIQDLQEKVKDPTNYQRVNQVAG